MTTRKILFALICVTASGTGCKKSGGPTGGGGGGWLVGERGLMVNVQDDDPVGGYELGADVNLNAIACRYDAEAWVVGEYGTLLYTNNGGVDWEAQTVPTAANLRSLATQDDGPVFVGGDGTFLVTLDTGATWRDYGDGTTSFRSMSTAFLESGVVAISEDGGFWRFRDGVLERRTTLAGARAVHQTIGGDTIVVVGDGAMYKSVNGGATFQPLTVDPGYAFSDVRVNPDGSATAVGEYGVVANIDRYGSVAIQYLGAMSLHTMHIHHDTTGYAAGDDGQVFITEDQGLTWRLGPNVGRTVRGVDEIGFGHR